MAGGDRDVVPLDFAQAEGPRFFASTGTEEANLDYLDAVELFQPSLRCWIPLPPSESQWKVQAVRWRFAYGIYVSSLER